MTPWQRFIEDEVRSARTWTTRVLADLARTLAPAGGGGAVGMAVHEAQRALVAGEAAVQAQWIQTLRQGMESAAGPAAPLRPSSAAGLHELALVDDDQAQEDIEVMRIVQLVEHGAETALRELQALCAALQGHDEIRPGSHPMGPDRVARALREGLRTLALPRSTRVMLLNRAAVPLAAALRDAYAESVERLEAQGVVPLAYRTIRLTASATAQGAPAAPSSAPAAFDPTRPGALDALAARLPPGSAGGVAGPSAVIERLFDLIGADTLLPAGARAAIERLRPAAVQIVAHDRTLLHHLQHPTWRLVDAIAAPTVAAEQPDDPRLAEWLEAVRVALDAVASRPPQAHLHGHVLRSLESKATAMLEAERADAASVIERLDELVRRDHLRAQHQERVTRHLQDATIGPELRQFLIETWSEVLTAAVMRYGDDSRQMLALQAVVPGLLRSLQPVAPMPDAAARARDNDRLCQWIGKGLTLIGWPEVHRVTAVAHVAALQARAAQTASAEVSPEELVRRLRDEDDSVDVARHDPGPESLIDVANLDTLPTPLTPRSGAGPSTAWLHQLVPGLVCTGFVRARWRALRLVWISADARYLLFSGSPPGRRFSLKRAALERLAAEGLFRPLELRRTVERAFDAMGSG